MPNVTPEQYEVLLERERAREARKAGAGGQSPAPVTEQAVQARADRKVPRKAKNPNRYAVCVKACRTILLDPDNLVGGAKYFIDSLRVAGLIPDDSPDKITLNVTQEKVKTKAEQCTIVEVEKLPADSYGPYGADGDAKWSGPS